MAREIKISKKYEKERPQVAAKIREKAKDEPAETETPAQKKQRLKEEKFKAEERQARKEKRQAAATRETARKRCERLRRKIEWDAGIKKIREGDAYQWLIEKPWRAGLWTGGKLETGSKYVASVPAGVVFPTTSFAAGTIIGYYRKLTSDLSSLAKWLGVHEGKTRTAAVCFGFGALMAALILFGNVELGYKLLGFLGIAVNIIVIAPQIYYSA